MQAGPDSRATAGSRQRAVPQAVDHAAEEAGQLGLAALLSHPRLSVQLQQLDLSSTTITQAERPEPGAATLANLFHASRLKQLSLLNNNMVEDGNNSLLPNLQPLSQHLTQLCIQQQGVMGPWCLSALIAALQPAKLAQLQVLTVSYLWLLGGLPSLLRVLPQLHTLQLPCAIVLGQEELDTLLAATQLTSLQLGSLDGLTSSRADVPCSWQRLELTGCVDCSSAAHLPLHSLTQPLVLAALGIVADTGDDCAVVAAAVHHLTQVCKVPVRIKVLKLCMSDEDSAAPRHAKLQQLVAVLQALKHCCWGRVRLSNMNVGAANVATLAPLCQGCTHLEFFSRNVTPSLEFWRQLVQLMPTVTHVAFKHVRGSASAAMHQSLQLMAEQPWARWLDICILQPSGSDRLPTCWQASPLTQPGKLRAHQLPHPRVPTTVCALLVMCICYDVQAGTLWAGCRRCPLPGCHYIVADGLGQQAVLWCQTSTLSLDVCTEVLLVGPGDAVMLPHFTSSNVWRQQ
ncbi:hypothetical protein HaLaN_20006 [Haematococcus lacustris]|uniref:Uncharacterized protein n=1 Tax=Haematococcus lacustris TaxID=44745 RepID=A0A699ZS25_HAELA|nr:hypothetical protein HaLaN_20006 [Haematococcus lacustris]